MINREKFEAKCEAIVSKYNMRVDWDASPIIGLVWDGELDADAEAIVRGADVTHLRKYIARRPSIMARKAAQAQPATALEAPATLTLEEQIKAIKAAEAALARWHDDFARRMQDESLSSTIPAAPSVDAVRKQYPEAAAELDARRAKAAEERAKANSERVAKIDPWNL